jgi:hypothetical protein
MFWLVATGSGLSDFVTVMSALPGAAWAVVQVARVPVQAEFDPTA